jgi:hypothetical protein
MILPNLNPIRHLLALGAYHILHIGRIRVKETHETAYKLVEFLELMFAFIKETEPKLQFEKLWKLSPEFNCSGFLLIFCCLLGCYFCVERYIITDVSKEHDAFILRIGLFTLENIGTMILRKFVNCLPVDVDEYSRRRASS